MFAISHYNVTGLALAFIFLIKHLSDNLVTSNKYNDSVSDMAQYVKDVNKSP